MSTIIITLWRLTTTVDSLPWRLEILFCSVHVFIEDRKAAFRKNRCCKFNSRWLYRRLAAVLHIVFTSILYHSIRSRCWQFYDQAENAYNNTTRHSLCMTHAMYDIFYCNPFGVVPEILCWSVSFDFYIMCYRYIKVDLIIWKQPYKP